MGIVDMGTKADEKNRKPLPGESKGAGVQSAKGGAIDPSQTMHSVNEQPVVPVINTYAQTEAIRAENKVKPAATPQPAADAKPAETTPATSEQQKESDPTKVVVKTKKTADFTPHQFTATPYDADAATKKMEKSRQRNI
jgi:hypothetical protein